MGDWGGRAWMGPFSLTPALSRWERGEDGGRVGWGGVCGYAIFRNLRGRVEGNYFATMSVTLEMDEQALNCLPLGPGERERAMQIELACRFYANGWLTLGQGARLAGLDQFAFGVALAERGIPRQYGLTEAQEDLAHARRQ